jgi:hypothetical protein
MLTVGMKTVGKELTGRSGGTPIVCVLALLALTLNPFVHAASAQEEGPKFKLDWKLDFDTKGPFGNEVTASGKVILKLPDGWDAKIDKMEVTLEKYNDKTKKWEMFKGPEKAKFKDRNWKIGSFINLPGGKPMVTMRLSAVVYVTAGPIGGKNKDYKSVPLESITFFFVK